MELNRMRNVSTGNLLNVGMIQANQQMQGVQELSGDSSVQPQAPVQDIRQRVVQDVGQNVPDAYLSHCTNGVKALCEKFHFAGAPAPEVHGGLSAEARIASAANELGIRGEEIQGLADKKGPADIQDERLRTMVTELMAKFKAPDGAEMGDDIRFTLAAILIKEAFSTDRLQQIISAEKILQAAKVEGAEQGAGLQQVSQEAILEKISEAIRKTHDRLGDAHALTPQQWHVALEMGEYDMNSVEDMVKIANHASANLITRCGGRPELEPVQRAAQELINTTTVLKDGDDNDVQLQKLAASQRALKSFASQMKALVKAEGKKPSALRNEALLKMAKENMEIVEVLNTQIQSIAKASLQEKILKAQSEHVRNLHEQGGSQMCTVHIDAGPEISILDSRFSLGVKLSFTYTFMVSVAHPHGQITIMNSIEAGVNLEGNFATLKDPVSGQLALKGHYNRVSMHLYNTPEELADAEGGRMLEKLMHYAKPPELPKTDTNGLKTSATSTFKSMGSFFKTIGNGVAGLFKPSAKKLARNALLQNDKFKSKMQQLNVFGQFDILHRKSVNKQLMTTIVMQGGGGDIAGKENFLTGVVKGLEQKFAYSRMTTTITNHSGLIGSLKTPEHLKDFVAKEYGGVDVAHTTGLLSQEVAEFTAVANGTKKPKAVDLLKSAMRLSGEFSWFCEETNKVDMAKRGLVKKNTVDRTNLMANRSASNRGEYFRATLVRLASLKYQLSQVDMAHATPEEVQAMELCRKMLDGMQPGFERPPVVLSRKNMLCLVQTGKTKTTSNTVELDFKCKFNPPGVPDKLLGNPITKLIFKNGKPEPVEVEANMKITIPSSKKGVYKNHNSATVSFSLAGDLLVQFGSQIVGNVIKTVQERYAAPKGSKDKPGAGTLIAECLKDEAGNIINDMSGTAIQTAVSKALKEHKLEGTNAEGEELSLADMVSMKIMNKEVFTVTINLDGALDRKNRVNYSGLSITNTRSSQTLLMAGVPVSPTVKAAANAMLMATSTHQVFSSLGTKSFAPLLKGVYEVGSGKTGIKSFMQHHKKALSTMTKQCVNPRSTLYKELEIFMEKVTESNNAFLAQGDGQAQKIPPKMMQMTMLQMQNTMQFIKHIASLPNSNTLMKSEKMTKLMGSVGELAGRVAAAQKKSPAAAEPAKMKALQEIARTIDEAQQGLPENEPIYHLASIMKQMDLML